MKTLTLLLGTGFGLLGMTPMELAAQGPFISSYSFDCVTTESGTNDPTPVPMTTGLLFGSFRAVGYAGSSSSATRFSWECNEPGGIDGQNDLAQFTGELNAGKYLEVTLSPEESWSLDLDSISFGVRRNLTGIRSYAVRSSLDGFSANLPAIISNQNTKLSVASDNSFYWVSDIMTLLNDVNGSRIVLGSNFEALTMPVTFRFYAWNAEADSGTFCIDNVSFRGSILGVPEPGTGVLLTAGLIWLLSAPRRGWNSESKGAGQRQGRPAGRPAGRARRACLPCEITRGLL